MPLTLSAFWSLSLRSKHHIQAFPFFKTTISLLFAALVILLPTLCQAKESRHHKLKIEGWDVYIEQQLVDKNDVRVFLTLRLLSEKLRELKVILPAKAITQLKTVPIYFSEDKEFNAEYYFFAPYVYRSGKDIKMMDGIEFRSISFFLQESKFSPMLVLHELAHAYHKLNYKRIDKLIMRAYRKAETGKLYQRVLTVTNRYSRAYALQSPFEYFAELTEAYFGRNNYYPFDRNELESYDKYGYEMIREAWLQ